MEDGGFVLNIAASSSGGGGAGGGRHAKKKNSFRAKQTAKRAKLKAKGGNKTQSATGRVGANGSPKKPHTKPEQKTQQQRAKKPSGAKAVETGANKTEAQSVAADADESEKADANDMARFDSGSESEQETAEDPVDDDVNDSNDDDAENTDVKDVQEEPTAPATAAVTEEKEGEGGATTRGFGTRRNPNKALYDPETFVKVRTNIIDTSDVLDEPLASTSSEKIFAEQTFESMQLHPRIIQVLKKDAVTSNGFGFERPTTVQVKSIPAVLSGKDILVKSETGSGKTLSYLLPIVQKLQSIEPRVKREDGCLALILAPTRELCLQILETATKLIQPFVYLVPGTIIGGEKKKAEKARLRKGIPILIATPGRLADHLINTQSFNYAKLHFLVLDEADRLLDMGFEKQITQILSIIDTKTTGSSNSVRRQNVLVSATINSGVQELAKMSLKQPLLIDADAELAKKNKATDAANKQSEHENFSTPHQLMQHFILVQAKVRLCALTCFLRQELNHSANKTKSKIVVFMSTCDAVDFHYALFGKTAWPASRKKQDTKKDKASESNAPAGEDISTSLFGSHGKLFRLHGNILQKERMTTFKDFCLASSGVLLCTDVAARGLNLPTVQWIVQYDPPTETRDYVHRVGRTARSGNQGSSLLFLMPSESEYLDHLKKHGLTMAALSLEKTISRAGKYGGFMKSNKKLPHEVVQSDLQFLYDQTVLADKELFALACQAFHSFVRSYATHTNDTRAIFHVRSLHFGHIAKSFALREPPASSKVRETGRNAKKGTLQKRKDLEDKEKMLNAKRVKKQREQQRHHAQHVSEFAD